MADDPRILEKRLVGRCLAGDGAAWREFVDRYAPFLLRQVEFALRRCGRASDPQLAQDLFQETFGELLANRCAALRNFRWDSGLERYLAIVAGRTVVHALRRERRLDLLDADGFEGGDSPARPVEAAQTREKVRAALGKLTERERLALQWFYWDSLPVESVARLLSLQAGAAKVLLHRARERLREFLRSMPCL